MLLLVVVVGCCWLLLLFVVVCCCLLLFVVVVVVGVGVGVVVVDGFCVHNLSALTRSPLRWPGSADIFHPRHQGTKLFLVSFS